MSESESRDELALYLREKMATEGIAYMALIIAIVASDRAEKEGTPMIPSVTKADIDEAIHRFGHWAQKCLEDEKKEDSRELHHVNACLQTPLQGDGDETS